MTKPGSSTAAVSHPYVYALFSGMPGWLFGWALLSRAAVYALVLKYPGFCLQGDSSTYLNLAHQLWSTQTYSYTGSLTAPAVILPPGYPLLLAPFTPLGSTGILIVAFLQSLLGILNICCLWRWLLLMSDRRGAIWGTTLFAVDWTLLAHTPIIMADGVMVYLLTMAFYQFWKAMRSRHTTDILVSALLWGVAPMVKPVALYLPLFLSGIWVRTRKAFLIFLMSFSLIPLFWMSRNYHVSGRFIFSSMGGSHLLDYIAANVEALRLNRSLQSVTNELHQRVETGHPRGYANEVEASQAYGEVGWDIVKAHPYVLIQQNLLGAVKLFAGTGVDMLFDLMSRQRDSAIRASAPTHPTISGRGTLALFRIHPGLMVFQFLYWLELLMLYWLFVRGLWRLWNAGRRLEGAILVGSCCYFLAFVSHVGYYRFRLLLMPLLAAGAAVGAAQYSLAQTKKELK